MVAQRHRTQAASGTVATLKKKKLARGSAKQLRFGGKVMKIRHREGTLIFCIKIHLTSLGGSSYVQAGQASR